MSLISKCYNGKDIWFFIEPDFTIWFRGVDILSVLQYADPSRALNYHVLDDDRLKVKEIIQRFGVTEIPKNWHPETIFVNESGFFKLCLESKMQKAISLQRWITSDVLPSIRMFGGFNEPNTDYVTRDELKDLKYTVEKCVAEAKQLKIENDELRGIIHEHLDRLAEHRDRLAVMPDDTGRQHIFMVLKHNSSNLHKFIRCQVSNLQKAMKTIPPEYTIIFRKLVPNAINILNKLKERIGTSHYTARHNEIETDADVLGLVEEILQKAEF